LIHPVFSCFNIRAIIPIYETQMAGDKMSQTHAEDPFEFPWVTPAPGDAPVELRPGLHWVRQSLPSRLDHVNQWLLADGDRVDLIDTGMDRPDARAWWPTILQRFGTLSRVVVTHHHYDHIGLSGFLCERYDAPLWITRTEWLAALTRMRRWDEPQRQFRRRHFSCNGLSEEQALEIDAHFTAFSARLSPIPAAFHRLVAGETIRLGGRLWTILLGEGHAPEQAMLFCGDANVLIAADQVLPSITPHIGVWLDEPEGNPLQLFLDTLDRLAALPGNVLVLPSHGAPFIGLHACLDRLRRHHVRRLGQTEAACVEWRTAAEIMGVLFPRARDVQDLALAFTETLAHIHYLAAAGRLETEITASGLRRFRRCAS
jgi:glyoxylase-like metal-dependent hydrolase (beta-lactamase superfamily II)